MKSCLVACFLFLFCISPAQAAPSDIPQQLADWSGWVLHDHIDKDCTPAHDGTGAKVCLWLSALELELDMKRLDFRFQAESQYEGWLSLPGSAQFWPHEVKLSGNRVAVINVEGVPSIWLQPGSYRVQGRISWEQLPQSVPLPKAFAMTRLNAVAALEGRAYVDSGSALWLVRDQLQANLQPDSLKINVFRKLIDDEPKLLETRLQLDVSGGEREEVLGGFRLSGWEQVSLTSNLPARVEKDGRLRIQVRPGSWTLVARFRQINRTDAFSMEPEPGGVWPESELWVVETQPQLRRVEIEGRAVDPQQTLLPQEWRTLPAFRVAEGSPLDLKEIERGLTSLAGNRIRQRSQGWLAFDQSRWIWRDRLTGEMSQGWRLEQGAPYELGKVDLSGQAQLVTQSRQDSSRGVEVRRADLDMTAVSSSPVEREAAAFVIPASGWRDDSGSLDLENVSSDVNLPPGWWPLAASGVDRSAGTWFDRWSLWDLFLLLLITAAVARLEGVVWGGVTVVALGFAYHEIYAPVAVWLLLIIPNALLRVVRPGWMLKLVTGWRWGALLILAGMLLNYGVAQVRMAIYPQLERDSGVVSFADHAAMRREMAVEEDVEAGYMLDEAMESAPPALMSAPMSLREKQPEDVAPEAPAPTGPGVPDWSWRIVNLTWQGPLSGDESAKLYVLSPMQTGFARIVHFALLVVLLACLVGRRGGRSDKGGDDSPQPGVTTKLAGLALLAPLALMAPTERAHADTGYPSPEMLQALEQRLTAPPACTPRCVDVNSANLILDGYSLTLSLEVSSLQPIALPIPARAGFWRPENVFVNGKRWDRWSAGEDGVWRIPLEAGVQEVVLEGGVREVDQFQLAFPLRPHRFSAKVADWSMSGAGSNELLSSNIKFERTSISQRSSESRQSLFQEPAPAFVKVYRELDLGLKWRVRTRVERVAPLRGSISASIPLLMGESVTSGDIDVSNQRALVTLDDRQDSMEWVSNLSFRQRIELLAPTNSAWSEHWSILVGPQWSLEYTGPAPYEIIRSGYWRPKWRPQPGDSLFLSVSPNKAVEGRMLTVDSLNVTQKVGGKQLQYTADIRLRTSRTQRYSFDLPDGAVLDAVELDGRNVARGEETSRVDVVLGYGEQSLGIRWHEEAQGTQWRYQTPALQLPAPVSNVQLQIQLPDRLWPLWVGGPQMGPAILFWGVLAVMLLLASVLGWHSGNPLGVGRWAVLAAGAALGWVQGLLVLAVWFYAFNYRYELVHALPRWGRRLYSTLLVLLTLAVLGWVIASIPKGLIGQPADYVAGNGSFAGQLRWYQDAAAGELPTASVWTVPVLFYRVAMLVWSLWLAFAMINWLRWAWEKFSERLPEPPVKPGRKDKRANAGKGDENSSQNQLAKPESPV
ncbi:hypothetical protein EUZ85_10650 [Hahella sp. KA22]|uniref:hypothetical protein n=1 Tax=Hahella sp. KA22 TaxID=1628392 RepID=UPI000FDD3D34|nr:hypothetical protein [Hahella sp. KA22]AZZ91163.1 hypothetical protein ENC22_08095 [Hahella sp. KA22]QAY54531.1 hypothetical protein EUZ85_10650 [Hahella sp. KA22]